MVVRRGGRKHRNIAVSGPQKKGGSAALSGCGGGGYGVSSERSGFARHPLFAVILSGAAQRAAQSKDLRACVDLDAGWRANAPLAVTPPLRSLSPRPERAQPREAEGPPSSVDLNVGWHTITRHNHQPA